MGQDAAHIRSFTIRTYETRERRSSLLRCKGYGLKPLFGWPSSLQVNSSSSKERKDKKGSFLVEALAKKAHHTRSKRGLKLAYRDFKQKICWFCCKATFNDYTREGALGFYKVGEQKEDRVVKKVLFCFFIMSSLLWYCATTFIFVIPIPHYGEGVVMENEVNLEK